MCQIDYRAKKSLGIKELTNGKLLLGGAFENNSPESRDLFIQLVNSDGSSNPDIELKKFVHSGTDCEC